MSVKINWDALGITTSVVCAIHCAVLPLVLTSFPILGINIIHNIPFEYFMIALAFLVGLHALFHGYQKHHHNKAPLIVFSMGIFFLLAKQMWHNRELWFLVPAVVLIVTAHYTNFRLLRLAHRSGDSHFHSA